METNKIGVIFLISILALAGTGVGYAMWLDNVDITATATTGNLEYRITNFAVTDQTKIGDQPATWTGAGSYGGEPESIIVTVQPTYPGWEAICQITVKNTGNLPLKMHSLKMTRISGNSDLMDYYYWGIPDSTDLSTATIYWVKTFDWWTTERTYATLGIPEITILPGATETLEGYFKLDPNMPQLEDKPLTIKLTLYATTATIS